MSAVLADNGTSLVSVVTGTRWIVVGVPSHYTALGFVSQLEADARVAAADLDLGLEAPEGKGSTLPLGGILLASQIPTQSELLRIGADPARSRATGFGVRVAVIDTGILATLEGVADHVDSDGYDFLDNDSDPTDQTNGLDDDDDGLLDENFAHGSFVSSLIVAVAPDVRIVPFRVLDADGVGTSSAVASAIGAAVQQGIRVVNLSVSVPPEVAVVREAIENAQLLGVQVIAAAGNSGFEDMSQPSAMDSAFVVAAIDPDDAKADFSSYGSAVDLSAPGVELHGAYPAPPGTARWSGTSFSTALVTGGFALLRQLHPLWTVDDITARLRASAAPLSASNPGFDGKLGGGRLDLDAATLP